MTTNALVDRFQLALIFEAKEVDRRVVGSNKLVIGYDSGLIVIIEWMYETQIRSVIWTDTPNLFYFEPDRSLTKIAVASGEGNIDIWRKDDRHNCYVREKMQVKLPPCARTRIPSPMAWRGSEQKDLMFTDANGRCHILTRKHWLFSEPVWSLRF